MRHLHHMGYNNGLKPAMLLVISLGLAACGGGGGSASNNNNTPSNRAPTVSAGADQAVKEFTDVTLAGTASDADNDALTYSWEQTAGSTVAITGATSLTAGFAAPDVLAANSPEVFTFRLTVSDGSTQRSDSVDVSVTDNNPPVADAGADQNVVELSAVDLDGSGSSDADGDALTFSWVQTDGPDVVLTDADSAQASFTAPEVAAGATDQLTFELTVNDGVDVASDVVVVSVSEPASIVTIAGRLFYERPTPNALCRGYNFNDITLMPVRLATVLLLDSAGNELAVSQTDDGGNYSFSGITANTDVRVRVRAELLQTTGAQTWEVYVRDNTSNTTASLDNRPTYEVQWPLFNSGGVDSLDNDFIARTGWDTDAGAYDDAQRLAAPLSILDAILNGVLLIAEVDPVVDLGRIDAFWSINNSWVTLPSPDENVGELITAYYTSDPERDGRRNPSLFLRGDAIGRLPESRINTDEFDSHVILHEWGHFFEDELSRSDSRGGYHQIPGKVDVRVAFGEGWGTAIGAIAGEPRGCDTAQPATSGSSLDVENYNQFANEQGFFNELSVATLLYDLWDQDNDGFDTASIGFGPIYEVMTAPQLQKDTEGFTTLFSFATYLRQVVDPADIQFVDAQLRWENVDTDVLDIWGSGQTTAPAVWHDGKPVNDLLPLYTQLTPGAGTKNVCVNVETRVPEADTHNNPGKWAYLYFTLDSTSNVTLTIDANPVPPATTDTTPDVRDRSDPDVRLYRNGVFLAEGVSSVADREVFAMGTLEPGTYALEFHDWRHVDFNTPTDPPTFASDYPERTCFDFTLN
ncbi:MAG: hypothetical protein HKO69_00560 [Woeseiaceae bacterium]|nr:hypothetical protein [Woeseiaceae bacterium]